MPTGTPRRGPGQRAGLDRLQIIQAALRVIDEHGMDGLTMRRLGAELGVNPTAFYAHFDNRAALLDAVIDSEAARLMEGLSDPGSDPFEILVAVAVQYRRALLAHPNLAPILATHPLPHERAPVLIRIGAELLRQAGFDDAVIPLVSEISTRFSLGYALHEAGLAQRDTATALSFRENNEQVLEELVATDGDTDLAQAIVRHRLRDDTADANFEAGFRALLNGLRG